MIQAHRRPRRRPPARRPAVLPQLRLHGDAVGAAAGRGLGGLPPRPAPGQGDRRAVPDAPLHDLPVDGDVPALLPAQVRAGRLPQRCACSSAGRRSCRSRWPASSREASACCRWRATAARSCRRSAATNLPDVEMRRLPPGRQQARHHRPAAARRRGADRQPGHVRAAAARRGGAAARSTGPT